MRPFKKIQLHHFHQIDIMRVIIQYVEELSVIRWMCGIHAPFTIMESCLRYKFEAISVSPRSTFETLLQLKLLGLALSFSHFDDKKIEIGI